MIQNKSSSSQAAASTHGGGGGGSGGGQTLPEQYMNQYNEMKKSSLNTNGCQEKESYSMQSKFNNFLMSTTNNNNNNKDSLVAVG